MNEGEFDKIISKKLKDEGADYPNLDANWQKVKDKMAHLQDQKPSVGGLVVLPNSERDFGQKKGLVPILLVSMLLLMGANGWLFWRLSNSMDKNVPVTSKKQEAGKTIRQFDTIIETKVIYKIDTVYQKVIVVQPFLSQTNIQSGFSNEKTTPSVSEGKTTDIGQVFNNETNPKIAQKQPNSSENGAFPKKNTIKDATSIYSNDVKTSNTDVNKNNTTVSEEQTNHRTTVNIDVKEQTMNDRRDTKLFIDSTQTPHLSLKDSLNDELKSLLKDTSSIAKAGLSDTLVYAKVPFDSIELKPTESLQKIIKASPKKIIIDHYSVGLQGGVSTEKPSREGVNPSEWYGLIGEIAFKKRLRLSLSLDNSTFHFKTTTRDVLLNVPSDPPMTENYVLRYIEGQNSSIQAGIGFTYLLASQSRVKPFVSGGYMRRWVLPYEAEFEFTNKLTGDHKSFDVKSTIIHKDNWLNIGVGMEMLLWHRINTRLKAEYIYDPNHGNIGLNQFLLRGGIFYKF